VTIWFQFLEGPHAVRRRLHPSGAADQLPGVRCSPVGRRRTVRTPRRTARPVVQSGGRDGQIAGSTDPSVSPFGSAPRERDHDIVVRADDAAFVGRRRRGRPDRLPPETSDGGRNEHCRHRSERGTVGSTRHCVVRTGPKVLDNNLLTAGTEGRRLALEKQDSSNDRDRTTTRGSRAVAAARPRTLRGTDARRGRPGVDTGGGRDPGRTTESRNHRPPGRIGHDV
jgi:hypothetical protein